MGTVTVLESRYALKTLAYRWMPPIWLMTVGIAVAMIELSSATRNVATNSASVISRRPATPLRLNVRRRSSGGRLGRGGLGGGTWLRQPDADQGAFALAGAAGPDAAAMLLDDVATDIQAEAHARDLALLGVAGATERLEDAIGRLRRQANALILNLDQHPARLRLDPHPQLRAVGRVLDRVIEQIRKHLLESIRVGRDLPRGAHDVQQDVPAGAALLFLIPGHDLAHELGDVQRPQPQGQAASADARDVQQVPHQAGQSIAGVVDAPQGAL